MMMNQTKYRRNMSPERVAIRMARLAGKTQRENAKLRVYVNNEIYNAGIITARLWRNEQEEIDALHSVIDMLRWQLDLANGDRFEARMLAEGKGE